MTGTKAHWDRVYTTQADDAVSWHQDDPQPSLGLIAARVKPGEAILDAGGGASRLVDGLLDAGLGPVTVLDLSHTALDMARSRLGPRAQSVTWIAADVTRWTPDRAYALWHDRAVFHFLTEARDRAGYAATLRAALPAGGTAIISGFAPSGPARCSGLQVMRFAPEALAAELNRHVPGLVRLTASQDLAHRTPGGARQDFHVSVFAVAPP